MTGDAADRLLTAIGLFASDPSRSGKIIRAALDADPAGFVRTLIHDTEHTASHRGFRYALILLRDRSLLLPALLSPDVTDDEQAARLMENMMSIDRNFINVMLDWVLRQPAFASGRGGVRVIDLIAGWADDVTNWRRIASLYKRGDERLRAQCDTLLARYRFSAPVMLARFGESEPRVRASIVEALRDADPETTGRLIEQALTDSDNRVAGSACMALYRAGDARALSCLAQMLERPQPEFRITAARVMGQLGDPRFAVPLIGAVKDGDPRLRATAARSLGTFDRLDVCAGTAEHMVFWTEGTATGEPLVSELRKRCRAQEVWLHCWPAERAASVWTGFLDSLRGRYVVKAGSGPDPAALTIREYVDGVTRYSKPARFSAGAQVQ